MNTMSIYSTVRRELTHRGTIENSASLLNEAASWDRMLVDESKGKIGKLAIKSMQELHNEKITTPFHRRDHVNIKIWMAQSALRVALGKDMDVSGLMMH